MIQIISLLFELVFGLIKAIADIFIEFIAALTTQARKTEYNADFIPARHAMHGNDTGFCLTGNLSLSIEESTKNALVLGGSGSGKSSIVLINSALRMGRGNSSLIINDPSGELRIAVSGALWEKGYTIKVIDYNNPASECFNPLLRCKTISDIQKLASQLLRNALGEAYHKDAFWNKSAEALISLFIRYLVFYAAPEVRTLYNALYLINAFSGSPKKVDKLFVKTSDAKLLFEYKAFVAYGDKTLSGIIATCKAALSIFSDETVAKISSIDTIDFEEFREKKTALFINNNVPDMHYYGTISSLFFQQFFNEIMIRLPEKNDLPVFFLLDECSSINLSGLSTTIANIRKYKSGLLLIFQDYHQLEHLYGTYEAKNISANCFSKVYLPGQPFETCKMLETTLGHFQYEDEKEITRTRQLMTADEIRMSDKAIILIGNKPPILAKLKPFYESRKMSRLTQIPPYEPEKRLPFEEPALIQFEDEKE